MKPKMKNITVGVLQGKNLELTCFNSKLKHKRTISFTCYQSQVFESSNSNICL